MTVIRNAEPSDYDRFAELFLELGVPEPAPPREEFDARHVANVFFVCDDAAHTLGYGLGSALGERWYVMHVVSAREARGRGVGRLIMDEHARRARAAGLTRWALNVKRDNATAIRLYERCGMKIVATTWAMRIEWADVERMHTEAAHESIVIAAADDEEIEASFRCAKGHLAAERARAGRILLGVRSEGSVVAFASFDPTFPGAYPFRPLETRWTRALLDAIRQHARPEDSYVRMVVENDEAVVKTLTDAGGRLLVELFGMQGEWRGE